MSKVNVNVTVDVVRDGATAWVARAVFADGSKTYWDFAFVSDVNDEDAALVVAEAMLRANPEHFWREAHGIVAL